MDKLLEPKAKPIERDTVGSSATQSVAAPYIDSRETLADVALQPKSIEATENIASVNSADRFNEPDHLAASIKQSPSGKHSVASAWLLAGIILSSGACGYLIAQSNMVKQAPLQTVSAGVSVASLPGPVDSQKLKADDVEQAAQSELANAALTEQLGQMRAELLRLHTLFVRLAELAELDEGEFDLDSPLLDWQQRSSLERAGLLNRRIAHMSGSVGIMETIFGVRRVAFDQKISGKPIVDGYRTSGFGYRTDPLTGERLEHLGLDFSGPIGEPILALADGIVTFSGKNSGYGNMVELEHVDGFRTRYAHNRANLVSTGARVKKGEPIAMLGSTGRSTGPHVHVEVRLDGSPIDPAFFVQ